MLLDTVFGGRIERFSWIVFLRLDNNSIPLLTNFDPFPAKFSVGNVFWIYTCHWNPPQHAYFPGYMEWNCVHCDRRWHGTGTSISDWCFQLRIKCIINDLHQYWADQLSAKAQIYAVASFNSVNIANNLIRLSNFVYIFTQVFCYWRVFLYIILQTTLTCVTICV